MMKSWSELPLEIQTIVFKLVQNREDKKHVSQCERVCKNWIMTTQSMMYNSICLSSKTQFDKFIDAVINNTQHGLEKSVKRISFEFNLGSLYQHQAILETLATHLPNITHLVSDVNCGHDFYLVLLLCAANSRTKFKHLEYISTPSDDKDMGMYIECALIYKTRLKSLAMSDKLEAGQNDPDISKAQYNRLLNGLNRFPQLTHLQLIRATNNEINTLDSVTERCRWMKSLDIKLHPDTNYTDDDAVMNMSLCTPQPNMKIFKAELDSINYNNMLQYITCKYPQLENISLDLKNSIYAVNNPVLTQFMSYLGKVPTHSVLRILVNTDYISGALESYWASLSREQLQKVEIRYIIAFPKPNHVFVDLYQSPSNRATILNYTNLTNVLSHLDILEKSGSRIGSLTIAIVINEEDLLCRTHMIPTYMLNHAFLCCPNLNELTLRHIPMMRLESGGPKSTSAKKLILDGCEIDKNALSALSQVLVSLNSLTLHNCYFRDTACKLDQPTIDIDMMNTSFEALTLEVKEWKSLEKLYFKLSTTKNGDTYYKHVQRWMHNDAKHSLADSN